MTLHQGTSRLLGPHVLFTLRILFAFLYLGGLAAALFFIIIRDFRSFIILWPIVWYCIIAFILLAMCAYHAENESQSDPPSYTRTANILLFSATALFLAGLPIEATSFSDALYSQPLYSARGFTLISSSCRCSTHFQPPVLLHGYMDTPSCFRHLERFKLDYRF